MVVALFEKLGLPSDVYLCEKTAQTALTGDMSIEQVRLALLGDAQSEDSQEHHSLGLEEGVSEETAQQLVDKLGPKLSQ